MRFLISRVVGFYLMLALGVTVNAATLSAQHYTCPVEFEINVSHAALLLDILEDDRVTDQETELFLAHPISDDVIRKTRSYGLEVAKENLATQIRQLTTGEDITSRSFGLRRYMARRNNTAQLVGRLQRDLPGLMTGICAMIGPYIPPGHHFRQEIVLVSAVNSTGFTFDDASRFYLVAEAFDGDLDGMGDIIVHESYHAVQNALISENIYFSDEIGLGRANDMVMRLLAGVLLEGTATHVADPIAAGQDGAMRRFQYSLAMQYMRDPEQIFALFDTTLFRAFHDPDVEYYPLHKIGLEGNEAFYYLGAMMTRAISEADGPGSIPAYFSQSPTAFFRRYIELADVSSGTLITFSNSTRRILEQLHAVE